MVGITHIAVSLLALADIALCWNPFSRSDPIFPGHHNDGSFRTACCSCNPPEPVCPQAQASYTGPPSPKKTLHLDDLFDWEHHDEQDNADSKDPTGKVGVPFQA
ncbi:unnamed protein product [Zymoseptoria tritici ST99CH_1A5]|uniref:Secreted protein n=2 Tax=Zymoseptoria tritici TaxID=1047171 RepID=A0A2H1H894_ZYMTR|nr:unnamed protein product [Zymoseptoria tritici ST99CH_1E4]SMR64540.1 unnamed protein product [Zymoseptoria tritici ST99CH_3D1]SMY29881.1 unnamed protein product [Zymoseptoria tritici ST99CH_1A5]